MKNDLSPRIIRVIEDISENEGGFSAFACFRVD